MMPRIIQRDVSIPWSFQVPFSLSPLGIAFDSIVELARIILRNENLVQSSVGRFRSVNAPDDLSACIVGDASKKQCIAVCRDERSKPVLKFIQHLLFVGRWQPVLDEIGAANQDGQLPGESGSSLKLSECHIDGCKSGQVALAKFQKSVYFRRNDFIAHVSQAVCRDRGRGCCQARTGSVARTRRLCPRRDARSDVATRQ